MVKNKIHDGIELTCPKITSERSELESYQVFNENSRDKSEILQATSNETKDLSILGRVLSFKGY